MTLLKWHDPTTGGWCVGRVVEIDGREIDELDLDFDGRILLVRHAHTGQLEWVPESKLEPYPMRSEWEQP